MYKLDDKFNLELFVGKSVLQICYSLSEISISWDDEGWIQFMGPFSLNSMDYDIIYPVNTDFGLLSLIDKKVIEAKTNDERDKLILYFENKYELTLIGNPFYESFMIHNNGETIII